MKTKMFALTAIVKAEDLHEIMSALTERVFDLKVQVVDPSSNNKAASTRSPSTGQKITADAVLAAFAEGGAKGRRYDDVAAQLGTDKKRISAHCHVLLGLGKLVRTASATYAATDAAAPVEQAGNPHRGDGLKAVMELFDRRRENVTTDDVSDALEKAGGSRRSAEALLRRMLLKKVIKRTGRGVYDRAEVKTG